MTALRFDDVSQSFDGRPVLDGLNVAIEPGQIVGLIGDNGAGKTTFLRLAARILTPPEAGIRRWLAMRRPAA